MRLGELSTQYTGSGTESNFILFRHGSSPKKHKSDKHRSPEKRHKSDKDKKDRKRERSGSSHHKSPKKHKSSRH